VLDAEAVLADGTEAVDLGGYGRTAYQAGVPLNVIQGIYGHADFAETSYYIGTDQAEQRAGIDRFVLAFEGSRPGNVVSGPAARHFTDEPARSR
jgi:hypothetical protein